MQPSPKDGRREDNSRPETDPGRNVTAKKDPNRATEKVDAKKTKGEWGELPDYLLKHGRGSMPNVPERYRKYLEALTRQNQDGKN